MKLLCIVELGTGIVELGKSNVELVRVIRELDPSIVKLGSSNVGLSTDFVCKSVYMYCGELGTEWYVHTYVYLGKVIVELGTGIGRRYCRAWRRYCCKCARLRRIQHVDVIVVS